MLFKLSASHFLPGCASGDCGQTVSDILQGIRQSKSVDESGERKIKL